MRERIMSKCDTNQDGGLSFSEIRGIISGGANAIAAMAEEVAERAYRLGPSPVRQEAREAWLAEQPKASGQ